MRLAEALILRGDIQKRLGQLQDRFKRSSWVQEGEKPTEDPAKLRREVDADIAQLRALMAQINRTNITTRLASGETLMEALAVRDARRAPPEHLAVGGRRRLGKGRSHRSGRDSAHPRHRRGDPA